MYKENEENKVIRSTNSYLIKDELENDIEINDSKFIVKSKDSDIFHDKHLKSNFQNMMEGEIQNMTLKKVI